MFVGVQAFKDRVVQFARTWGHVLRLEFPHGGGGILSIIGNGMIWARRGACDNCPCIEHCGL